MTTQRDATFLLLGSATQDLAFRMMQVALPLVILEQTGSVAATGLVAGAQGLPVFLSPWWARRARQWVRSGRQLALVAVADSLALAVVPVAVLLHQLSVPVLIVAGLLLGVGETLGGPGRAALLADIGDLQGTDNAVRLLTVQDLFRRVGMIVGPAMGAFGVAAGLTLELLWLQVVTVLLAGVLAWPVRGTMSRPDSPSLSAAPSIREALVGRPDVLAGWLMRGTTCFTWFAFTLGLAVLGAQQGQPGVLYAWGMSGFGVGSVAGTLAAVRLVARFPAIHLARLAWTLVGLSWLLMALWSSNIGVAISAGINGLVMAVGISAVNATITRSSAGAVRRSLMSGQTLVVSASNSAGLLLGGAVLATIGVRPALALAGGLVVAIAIAVPSLVRASGTPMRNRVLVHRTPLVHSRPARPRPPASSSEGHP